jgi:rhamnosyltransferase subunit B
MAKILIHTLGSSGDFNPFVALALELRRRGHVIHFVLTPSFAAQTRELGFTATDAGLEPDYASDLMKRLLAPARNGINLVDILFREVLIPAIRPATEILAPLAAESDLFISHTIQLAARVVAQQTGVPWVSASPAALIYPTGSYPPPGVAWKGCPAVAGQIGWEVGRRVFRHLDAPANAEYASLGLPPISNVVLGGAYSRRLTLGLWSPSFFSRPSDWPDWFQIGGYGRWDAPPAGAPAPIPVPDGSGPLIVFTLGSSVVSDPRGFYEMALRALAGTDWRALLVGAPLDLPVPADLAGRAAIVPYAPYGDVFPLADAVVHSGGVGTTQACCFYGKPAILVPRGADQFENAAHIQREGWGLRLKPERLTATLIRLRLERLLRDTRITKRVQNLGEMMRAEPGPARSADLLEAVLAARD